jgi:hypothetical protein
VRGEAPRYTGPVGIDMVRLAAPRILTADAYREFCWGTGLPELPDGYGVLLGHRDGGEVCAAVVDDVEYARLLMRVGGMAVPAEKVVVWLDTWPDLRPEAASVWG